MTVLMHFGLWCFGLAQAETQTTEAERDSLARHATGKRHLAEIGVWHGVTTCRLRKAMDPEATLLAVDPYPLGRLGFSAQRIIAQRGVSKIRRGTVHWIRKTGADAAWELASNGTKTLDFVFVDGDHSYEGLKLDWEGWSGLLMPRGIVALHDSRSSPARPIDGMGSVVFTREVIERDPRFQIIDTVDSLTVLRRLETS
jgi:predicted O-methyltransferase YrrM